MRQDNDLQDKSDVISVSQLNTYSKKILEQNLPVYWIEGEISGLKVYSHVYFDLKDESAKISCVMFASKVSALDFKLENGQKIEIRGKVTLYEKTGSYQINIERARQVGLGELWEAYQKLLVKLQSEGLFEAHFKKQIPVFPKSIGVITSKEGSVIRDVITTLKRRMPNIPIIIYHTAVQGNDAAMQITNAIRTANTRQEVDVLIICRGGGSMEDLWCFNQESVAREVFTSHIPIISAVGHETDTTIIDYVSDLRAPTPTAAAELVAKSCEEWNIQIRNLNSTLQDKISRRLNDYYQYIDLAQSKLQVINPNVLIDKYWLKLGNARLELAQSVKQIYKQEQYNLLTVNKSLNNSMHDFVVQNKFKILDLTNKLSLNNIKNIYAKNYYDIELSSDKLNKAMQNNLSKIKLDIDYKHSKLLIMNPTLTLKRGYAFIKDDKGKIIINTQLIKHNQRLIIETQDNSISVVVDLKYTETQPELI